MKKVILFLILGAALYAQSPDPNKILKEVKAKFAAVKDYTVDAAIKIDVTFLKMPERKVKIYFKQPNKTHLESKEIAILPKMGLNFTPAALLNDGYVISYIKQEKTNGQKIDLISLNAKSDTVKPKYIKLWIDSEEKIIRKFELAPDRGGSVTGEITYGADIKMGLPSQIKFLMDFGSSMDRFPSTMGRAKKNDSEKKGTVLVTYTNYSINKGIDDKIFLEKKK